MSMIDEVQNVLYNSTLIAVAAVVIGVVTKKITGVPMGVPESLKGTATLVVAVAVGSFAVKQIQEKALSGTETKIDPYGRPKKA